MRLIRKAAVTLVGLAKPLGGRGSLRYSDLLWEGPKQRQEWYALVFMLRLWQPLAEGVRVEGRGAGIVSAASARSDGGVAPSAAGVGVSSFLDIFEGKPTQFAEESGHHPGRLKRFEDALGSWALMKASDNSLHLFQRLIDTALSSCPRAATADTCARAFQRATL